MKNFYRCTTVGTGGPQTRNLDSIFAIGHTAMGQEPKGVELQNPESAPKPQSD